MKRYLVLFLCLLITLSGCGNEKQVMQPDSTTPLPTNVTETESVTHVTDLYAVSVPAVQETYQAEDGTELFSYTAQHMQLILPNDDIADNIVLDFLNRIDASTQDAESIYAAAQNDYVAGEDWYPYYYQIIFSPTRIDQGVLSLFGAQSSYSGGLHGSLSSLAVNYDLTTGDPLTLGSIMHMDATKEDFITQIVDQLHTVSEECGLFDDYEEGVYARLSGDENLYEDFYFTQTGLCFFFSPYEIAPYASGVISVEIPYSKLTGLIYDGYFPAEREQISGSMNIAEFMQTDMEQFSSMAEVTLANGEAIMVVYPTGNVEDIRITVAADGITRPEYTVFAALEMSDQNAVVVSLTKYELALLNVSYASNGKRDTIPFT